MEVTERRPNSCCMGNIMNIYGKPGSEREREEERRKRGEHIVREIGDRGEEGKKRSEWGEKKKLTMVRENEYVGPS